MRRKSSKNTGPTSSDTATCAKSEPTTLNPLTSSVGDSRAKTSAMRVTRLVSQENEAAYGVSMQESFASYDHASCSWRTSQLCLTGEWDEFSETWPESGMTRNGVSFRLASSDSHICEKECSFWPTPRKSCHHEFCFAAKSQIKVIDRGISCYGPSATFAKIGFTRQQILAAYPAVMGFPVGWAKLRDTETPSVQTFRNG